MLYVYVEEALRSWGWCPLGHKLVCAEAAPARWERDGGKGAEFVAVLGADTWSRGTGANLALPAVLMTHFPTRAPQLARPDLLTHSLDAQACSVTDITTRGGEGSAFVGAASPGRPHAKAPGAGPEPA